MVPIPAEIWKMRGAANPKRMPLATGAFLLQRSKYDDNFYEIAKVPVHL
jgi:hypothetical protein